MDVYTRISLLANPRVSTEQAVLLEGSWPTSSIQRWSLDDTMHAAAGWVDDEAIRLAALYAAPVPPEGDETARQPTAHIHTKHPQPLSLAYIQERKLRYHLAKLLRVIAFFDRPPAGLKMADAAAGVKLHLAPGVDDDYAELFSQLAQRYHWRLELVGHNAANANPSTSAASSAAGVAWWRRCAGAWQTRQLMKSLLAGPRVVLCGNATGLDPVCEQLIARHAQVCWLYDSFCVRTWRRWRRQGVHQLLCLGGPGADADPAVISAAELARPIAFEGVNLTSLAQRWLQRVSAESAAVCTTRVQQIHRQFARLRPQVVVVDEDQTPLARIAVHVAREQGIPTVVLQHGVPRVAFGFVPLAADWFFAWGETSRTQLKQFGVSAKQIAVTGSARHDSLAGAQRWRPADRGSNSVEILLFATTPPNDARPESLRFHLTLAEHDRLLRMTFAAVQRLGARLIIKAHPRAARRTAGLRKLLAEFPNLNAQVIAGGDLEELVRRAACGISCLSGAGIDAASLGLPVIDLLPQHAEDLLPAQAWGTLGTARTADELESLLAQAMRKTAPCEAIPQVFAHHGYAASVSADALLAVARGERPDGAATGSLSSAPQRAHQQQVEPRPPHLAYFSPAPAAPLGLVSASPDFPSQRVSSR